MGKSRNSDGWFLTSPEMENVRRWKYRVEDESVSTWLLTPFWNWLLKWIPHTVAPNVLTLAGFLCLVQSAYLTYYKLESFPVLVTFLNVCLLFSYMTLDALDGKHARQTNNSSPVGELFDHTVDNIGVILIVMILSWSFGIFSPILQWYVVNCVQLVFLWFHLHAIRRGGVIEFRKWTGPGEALLACCGLLVLSLWFRELDVSALINDHVVSVNQYLFYGYLGFLSYLIYQVYWSFPYSTRNGIWLSLVFRIDAALISYSLNSIDSSLSMTSVDVFLDGLFWCLVTGDVILAKMAKRDLHPMIVIFAMASLISNRLIIVMAVVYYLSTFSDLLNYLNIPMFGMMKTVYVNGVYDVAHYNHMKSFEAALEVSGGNRLIVGVMSDEDTRKHKGESRPYDPLEDRVKFVQMCRMVNDVIPNAPWDDVPDWFIKHHGIDVVCHSEEYSPDDPDYAYRTPYEMGIVKLMPRGEGISTSKRVDRIISNGISTQSLKKS